MNILITGGSGFIANHLTSHLSSTHTVFAPSKTELNCLDEFSVREFFRSTPIDVVIHTALTGREDLFSQDQKYYNDALLMWDNIRNNKTHYKQLIHFGSAYDTLDTPYGKAKKAIAESCAETDHFYNLRLFGNFHASELNTRFFKKLQQSHKFVIAENKQFDFFHLEDVFPVVDFVINNTLPSRAFDLVYAEKRTLISQAMEFCVMNQVKTVIEVQNEGADFIGDHNTLSSFNLKLLGLEQGFKKYENSIS